MGAWIPGVIQGAQAKNAQKDLKRANAELTGKMSLSQQEYEARRPQVAAQRMAALRSQLGSYNPMNNMVNEMSGGRYSMDLDQFSKSPLMMKPTNQQINRGDDNGFTGMDSGSQNRRIEELAAQGYDVTSLRDEVSQQQRQKAGANRAAVAAMPRIASNVTGLVRGKK